jgi:hypothetical protein
LRKLLRNRSINGRGNHQYFSPKSAPITLNA